MQKVAPGFQQTSGSKEAAASLRKGHIRWLNLRYTQVSRQELRCLPCTTQAHQKRAAPSPRALRVAPLPGERGAGERASWKRTSAWLAGLTGPCPPLPHRDYASWNLSVNLYTVNAPWLFSLLWCAGVPAVTSDNSRTLARVPSPLWILVSWSTVGRGGGWEPLWALHGWATHRFWLEECGSARGLQEH